MVESEGDLGLQLEQLSVVFARKGKPGGGWMKGDVGSKNVSGKIHDVAEHGNSTEMRKYDD